MNKQCSIDKLFYYQVICVLIILLSAMLAPHILTQDATSTENSPSEVNLVEPTVLIMTTQLPSPTDLPTMTATVILPQPTVLIETAVRQESLSEPSSEPIPLVTVVEATVADDSLSQDNPEQTPSSAILIETAVRQESLSEPSSEPIPLVTVVEATVADDSLSQDNPEQTPSSAILIETAVRQENLNEQPSEQLPLFTVEATTVAVDQLLQNDSEQTLSPTAEISLDTIPSKIMIIPDLTNLTEGNKFTIKITAEGLAHIYSGTLVCQVNPLILKGSQLTLGSLFTPDNVDLRNDGFQADGQWAIGAAQRYPAPELNGSGILWMLDYEVINPGPIQISCTVRLADINGHPSQLELSDIEVTIVADPNRVSVTPTLANNNPIVATTATLITIPNVTFINGDVNNDNVVDMADVNLVAINFGLQVPPASVAVDLNSDGVIDLLDLTIVSANLNVRR